MTIIVEPTRAVTGGVDTHLDVHVAAVLDEIGGLLATESFVADRGGEDQLVGWLGSFGPLARVGVEGTGSYGAGLARLLAASGVDVVEVDRPNRQVRRRQGKTDTLDAIEAARAAQSGRATGRAKSRDGNVEAIRALVVAKRSARTTKTKSLNQIRHLGFTAPNPLRERLSGLTAARLVVEAASMRPRARHRCGDVRDQDVDAHSRAPGPRDRCRTRRARHPALRVGHRDRTPTPRAARRRHPHRCTAARHRRRQPPTPAQRSLLGTPVRGVTNPSIIRQSHPPPTQPRR